MTKEETIEEEYDEVPEIPFSFLGWVGLFSFSIGFILATVFLLLLR